MGLYYTAKIFVTHSLAIISNHLLVSCCLQAVDNNYILCDRIEKRDIGMFTFQFPVPFTFFIPWAWKSILGYSCHYWNSGFPLLLTV